MNALASLHPRAEAPGSVISPYVGLRPFQERDSALLFGRRQQVETLLLLLQKGRFLPVVGSSGCGKSSLVRAGLIPALKGGFLVRERDEWLVSTITPGNGPLRNLALALCGLSEPAPTPTIVAEVLEGIDSYGCDGVAERLKATLGGRKNFLLCVDQFEEVFALRSRFAAPSEEREDGANVVESPEHTAAREETDEFVSLLLELASRRDLPVYVVLTMRSDFLGDCDVFPGLPEAMNEARYLVPRLTREQLRQAIEGPLKLNGGSLEPRLLDRLLNEVADRPDQLPVTQHALLRTWQAHTRHAEKRPISQADYEEAGTLDRALALHAAEALRSVPQELAAKLFQALTDIDARKRRVRRSATVGELVALTHAEPADIAKVLDAFVTDQRDFLTLAGPADAPETLVTITHESLIRRWKVLRDWVDLERSRKEKFLVLAERAASFGIGKGARLTGPDLKDAEDWYKEAQPTSEWVARYHGRADLATVVAYIRRSRLIWRLQALSIAALVLALAGVIVWSAVMNSRKKAEAVEARDHAVRAQSRAVEALGKFRDVANLFAAARAGDDYEVGLLASDMSQSGRSASLAAWSETASKALVWSAWQRFAPKAPAQVVAASPVDARIAVAQANRVITVWDSTANPPLIVAELSLPPKVFVGSDFRFTGLAFSADGSRIAATDDFRYCVIWPLAGGEPVVKELPEGVYFSAPVGFSGNLERLAWSRYDGLRLWSLTDGRVLGLTGAGKSIALPAFDPAGRWVAAPVGFGFGVWSADDGRELRQVANRLRGRASDVAVRAARPEVALLGDEEGLLATLEGKVDRKLESDGRSPTFSPDGQRLAYLASGGRLLIARPDSNEPTLVAGRLSGSPVFDSTGRRIVGVAADGTIEIWRAAPDAVRTTLASSHMIALAAMGAGSELAIVDFDDQLRITASGEALGPFALEAKRGYVRPLSLVLDASSRTVAVRTSTGIQTRDFSGRVRVKLALEGSEGLALGPSGRLAVKTWRQIDVYDAGSTRPTASLKTTGGAAGMAFDRSGATLAIQENADVLLWRVGPESAEKPERLSAGNQASSGSSGAAAVVVFNATETAVAAGSEDGVVRVWRSGELKRELTVLTGHQGPITGLAFDPDTKRLASASRDGTVRVWELPKPGTPQTSIAQPLVLAGHRAPVVAVAFAGDRVISIAADGVKTAWPATPDALAEALAKVSRQCLSAERRAELLNQPREEAQAGYAACLKRAPLNPAP